MLHGHVYIQHVIPAHIGSGLMSFQRRAVVTGGSCPAVATIWFNSLYTTGLTCKLFYLLYKKEVTQPIVLASHNPQIHPIPCGQQVQLLGRRKINCKSMNNQKFFQNTHEYEVGIIKKLDSCAAGSSLAIKYLSSEA